MTPPKISIITVNLNNNKGLKRTIESVLIQENNNIEQIIIDGGSIDGSISTIEKFEIEFQKKGISLKWYSEKDDGIYDAMNKGINIATGTYCYFLNSGDFFLTQEATKKFEELNSNAEFIYFNIMTNLRQITYPPRLTFLFFFRWTICHQAIFIRRSIFKEHGGFDTKYKLAADWVHLVENIALRNATYEHINKTITFFQEDGISSMQASQIRIKKERALYLNSTIPSIIQNDYLNYISTLEEIQFYQSSKLIQFVKKLQESKLYKTFRKVPS